MYLIPRSGNFVLCWSYLFSSLPVIGAKQIWIEALAIEKAFEGGRAELAYLNAPIYSLAVIDHDRLAAHAVGAEDRNLWLVDDRCHKQRAECTGVGQCEGAAGELVQGEGVESAEQSVYLLKGQRPPSPHDSPLISTL